VVVFLVGGVEFGASGRPVIVIFGPGTGLALQRNGSSEGGLEWLLLLLLGETVEGVGGLSGWGRSDRRGLGGLLAQGLEVGVLGLSIGCSSWEGVGADNLLLLNRRRRLGDSDSRNRRSR
jgi:hypothetical protein